MNSTSQELLDLNKHQSPIMKRSLSAEAKTDAEETLSRRRGLTVAKAETGREVMFLKGQQQEGMIQEEDRQVTREADRSIERKKETPGNLVSSKIDHDRSEKDHLRLIDDHKRCALVLTSTDNSLGTEESRGATIK